MPSLARAVIQDGDIGTGGSGGAGPRTIFQVGSVTKVFTALLLADMAERGEVRLSDPAARYLLRTPLVSGWTGVSPGGWEPGACRARGRPRWR